MVAAVVVMELTGHKPQAEKQEAKDAACETPIHGGCLLPRDHLVKDGLGLRCGRVENSASGPFFVDGERDAS
jgi:hypothetical protein